MVWQVAIPTVAKFIGSSAVATAFANVFGSDAPILNPRERRVASEMGFVKEKGTKW